MMLGAATRNAPSGIGNNLSLLALPKTFHTEITEILLCPLCETF